MKKKSYSLVVLLVLCLSSMAMQAQVRYKSTRHQLVSAGQISNNYADSLRLFADSLFNSNVKVSSTLTEQDMAPLFLPLAFYRSISHRAFDLDKELTPLDTQLLNVYLQRPDMVEVTQSELEEIGPAIAPTTIIEKPTMIVRQMKPEEPEAEPVDLIVLKPNFWNFRGDYYLQFLQNYVSDNWYQGGESNYSMVGSLSLEANYNNKQKVKWDNKLEMKLGLQTATSDSLHKLRTNTDMFRYTGKLGLQASKKWYYTLQVIAQTQFMRNYKANKNETLSDFMSPFNLNLSLGMDYTVDWLNHRLTGTVHFAPLAYNFKYVDRLSLAKRNGITEGNHSLHDFGSQFTMDFRWKFADNISWKTRLYGYTTYKRVEMEWENTLAFQFNKYISTQIFVYPRFDDDRQRDPAHGYFQFKEFISLGFSYSF